MKPWITSVGLLAFSLLLAACGGPEPTPTRIAEPVPAASTAEADIKDFTHQDLAVKVGTSVVWTNRDSIGHTTSAVDGTWDSGALRKSQTFSFTFTEPGSYKYRCNIHSSMTATVSVTR